MESYFNHSFKVHNYTAVSYTHLYYEPHSNKSRLKLKLSVAEYLYLYPAENPEYSTYYALALHYNVIACGLDTDRAAGSV